ncbi:MAG: hypothetical protein GXO70_01645 [Acidobacteria bacterium]|nr:hypothetical protein [Acidobacteriota bacterium]
MKQVFCSFFLVFVSLSFIGSPILAENPAIDAIFPVPMFNSAASTTFTDICFDEQTDRLALCSDGGYGEFPIVNGKVQFTPPGFIAATGNFIIRGYTNTPAGLSAVDNRGKFVFWGKKGRLPIPVDVGNISGIAWDGSRLWIARQLPAGLFSFRLSDGNTLVPDRAVTFSFPVLQSVTFYNHSLWVTDGIHIFQLDSGQQIIGTWKLPTPVSGFCFAKGILFLVSLDGHSIYRFRINGI